MDLTIPRKPVPSKPSSDFNSKTSKKVEPKKEKDNKKMLKGKQLSSKKVSEAIVSDEPKKQIAETTSDDYTFEDDPNVINKDLPDDPEIPICETAQVV